MSAMTAARLPFTLPDTEAATNTYLRPPWYLRMWYATGMLEHLVRVGAAILVGRA